MTESRLFKALRQVFADLVALEARFALVGGLAVSVRAEPRFTRDVDLAVAVSDDRQAEALVAALRAAGYSILALVEQEKTSRLATVRLSQPADSGAGVVVDLLFASSGIEQEIVAAAETMTLIDGLDLPVATTAHLIATKVLAADEQRLQDRIDLAALVSEAQKADLADASVALALITDRGFHRGKDLARELREFLDGC